jgi:hypothetical protein
MRVWVNVWGKASARCGTLGLVAATLAAGCIDDFDNPKGYGGASDCGTLCAEISRCPSTETSENECRTQCNEIERIVRDAGCPRIFEDFVTCVARAPDVCDLDDACEEEAEDYAVCITHYCSNQPDECSSF